MKKKKLKQLTRDLDNTNQQYLLIINRLESEREILLGVIEMLQDKELMNTILKE